MPKITPRRNCAMTRHVCKLCCLIILSSIYTACARINPDLIQASGNDYNIAIQNTRDEQLLLNLIRLKYRDTPYFLEVNSVSSQFSLATQASIGIDFKEQQIPENVGVGGAVAFSEEPTVTYLPLQGNEFIQKLLSPITIETILLLTNSGWSLERILRLSVQDINNIPNAPTASGPTPETAPSYEAFLELSGLLKELYQHKMIQLGKIDDHGGSSIVLKVNNGALQNPLIIKLREMLQLEEASRYSVSAGSGDATDGLSININTRSLLGVMYYLSHATEVPEQDKKAGKVTLTLDTSGNEFDWTRLTQNLFRIKSGQNPGSPTTIATYYRDHWFYIEDSDLDSKSTFSLLTQLFSLQAGKAEGITPVLTLPIGR